MPKTLLQYATGVVALTIISASTLILCVVIYTLALGKLLFPDGPVKQWFRGAITRVAELWIGINNSLFSLYRGTRWDLQVPPGLDHQGCYLVVSNHQSWVDILVLQKCFNRKLPLLRFFLKKQLIWVPFLGIAWWALDFPFMHRASRAELEKQPELRGADLDSARRACEKFSTVPVSMMSFPEGTRFSHSKRERSGSHHQHLLKPKAGGVGQVLYALGERIDACIDVTIVYPGYFEQGSAPTFWQLISGQIRQVCVRARQVDIPDELRGVDSKTNLQARDLMHRWMSGIWTHKDQEIARLSKPRSTE